MMVEKQKKILFILNPISGIGKKNVIAPLIEKHFEGENNYTAEIRMTEHRNHAFEITVDNKANFDAIVAIGGDGSVNEVGSALVNSTCAMGIIPAGSGNGLARHLKVPLNMEEALLRIKAFQPVKIDTGTVNGRPFLGTCGFGFDAHISKKFDELNKRGFRTYIKLVIKEYKHFQPIKFSLKADGLEWTKKLVICSVANSCQFGNGFKISPKSVIDDGLFELVQINRFKIINAPFMVKRFFNGTIDKSNHFASDDLSSDFILKLDSASEVPYHLDGEPLVGGPEFSVKILKSSLKVI